ncbi:unnamed protein product [Thelazia callipaeda]|uniref:Cwf21 domain-containing protein n=1 Tax=Thelazia callipaeda TaxID=103827 RepID=A0A0N5D3N5_THECL|nr:unnamed protein product [Thelazia callipaeda]
MYNGIGLQTARGSGTNGYVQTNLANLLLSKKRVTYNSEADIKRAEAELNKEPNKELLEHRRKRHIELKCADFELLMENKGFHSAEIEAKVNEYRSLLQSQVESGELDLDAEMDIRDTHVRNKVAVEYRNRMRAALGIEDTFVDGTSFEKFVLLFDQTSRKAVSSSSSSTGSSSSTDSSSSEDSSSEDSDSSSGNDTSSTSTDESEGTSSEDSSGSKKNRKRSEKGKKSKKSSEKERPRIRDNSRHSRRLRSRHDDDDDDVDMPEYSKRRKHSSSNYYGDRHRRRGSHNGRRYSSRR